MIADLKALERELAHAHTLEKRMDALASLAWVLREHDLSRAISMSEQLLRIAKTVPDNAKYLGDAHRCMAGAKYVAGEIQEALRHALESLKQVEKSNDRYGLMLTRGILGNCYVQLGDYPAAQILYRQALLIAEELHMDYEIGRLSKNIGVVMSLQGDYHEAIACYDRALPYIEKFNDESELAKIYNNYAVEYVKLDLLKEAEYWANRAYEGFYKHGRWGGVLRAMVNLSHIYAKRGELELAQTTVQKALTYAEKSQSPQNIMLVYENSGEIALMADDTNFAQEQYHRALEMAEEQQARDTIFQCHEGLYKVYKAMGDTTKALYHHEAFHEHKEAIFNDVNATKWQNLEILHRTREARQEAHRQRALREADRQYFERLSTMKDDLINSASHDLKNPLAMMKTSLYLLKRHGRIDDEKGRNHLTMLDSQVNWMRDLIANILDLAWLEMGRAIHTEMIEVVAYLQQIVNDHEITAHEKQIQLQFETSIEAFTTALDPLQIRQVVNNLLSNAIKYTPIGGKIKVTVKCDEDLIHLSVCDTGYGIPAIAVPHLFERFYRVEDERHKNQEGTGLGLAIVKSIIEQHGGTITVQSQIDKGTNFDVYIPMIAIAEFAPDGEFPVV